MVVDSSGCSRRVAGHERTRAGDARPLGNSGAATTLERGRCCLIREPPRHGPGLCSVARKEITAPLRTGRRRRGTAERDRQERKMSHVLVVDDDKDAARMMAALITKRQFTVATANTLREA